MSCPSLIQDKNLAQLATLVGPQHVRHQGSLVRVVPAKTKEIAEVLRFASEHHAVVVPVGGGTKQQWGNRVNADIHLDLSRLNAIREHAWQDMTCTVEAGTRWANLQTELGKHGQMIAVDPLWPEHATVGGIIACNDSGAMRLKYGGLRDLIVGMTVVLADGTIAKTGGKVVKNVAGYDLHKLMTGSFGTLAVIAEVNFRLHPVEQHRHTWSIVCEGGDGAAVFAEPMRKVLDSQMTPTSVQLRSSRSESALDVRVASLPAHLVECAARLKDIAGHLRFDHTNDDVWIARESLFENAASVVLKVSTSASEICSLSQWLQEAWSDLQVRSVAQGNGLVTVAVEGEATMIIDLIESTRERVRPLGGSVVALQLPEALRERIDVWGPTSNPISLMQEIKRRFDPGRLLNPGRFVGSI